MILVLDGLSEIYINCTKEKNCTLIKADIIQGFKKLYNELKDERISKMVAELIEKEIDEKYKKKYLSIWKKKEGEKSDCFRYNYPHKITLSQESSN